MTLPLCTCSYMIFLFIYFYMKKLLLPHFIFPNNFVQNNHKSAFFPSHVTIAITVGEIKVLFNTIIPIIIRSFHSRREDEVWRNKQTT